jgi:hypothetical protein
MSRLGFMSGERVKELFRKYGKVALGVHLTVYASFFGGAPKPKRLLLPCACWCPCSTHCAAPRRGRAPPGCWERVGGVRRPQ